MTYSIQSQVDQVANAVSFLRNTLENNRIDDLTDALAKAQAALDQMNAYPGGVEQLRKDITALEQPLRQEIEDKLQKAGVDHQINGELIKVINNNIDNIIEETFNLSLINKISDISNNIVSNNSVLIV